MQFSKPVKFEEENEYRSNVRTEEGKKVFKFLPGVTYLGSGEFTLSEEACKTLEEFDSMVVSAACEHKKEWFGRETIKDETIRKSFQETAEENVLSSDFVDTQWFKVFDHEKKRVETELEENSQGKLAIEVSHIWFKKRSFGAKIKFVQILLDAPPPEPEKLPEYPDECMFD